MKSKMDFCRRCKMYKAFIVSGELMKCFACGLEKKVDKVVENE